MLFVIGHHGSGPTRTLEGFLASLEDRWKKVVLVGRCFEGSTLGIISNTPVEGPCVYVVNIFDRTDVDFVTDIFPRESDDHFYIFTFSNVFTATRYLQTLQQNFERAREPEY